jgi:hypothetical protein
LEATDAALRSAALTVIIVGALVVAVLPWTRAVGARFYGPAAVGAMSTAVVVTLQSGSVGASLGGAVLALAAGALAVLVVALFRNV